MAIQEYKNEIFNIQNDKIIKHKILFSYSNENEEKDNKLINSFLSIFPKSALFKFYSKLILIFI